MVGKEYILFSDKFPLLCLLQTYALGKANGFPKKHLPVRLCITTLHHNVVVTFCSQVTFCGMRPVIFDSGYILRLVIF